MAAYTQLECLDFSHFQETLRKMRLLDDTIVYALNTQIPTESFKAQKDGQVTCKELYTQLEKNYKDRGEIFDKCLEFSRARIADIKSKKVENEDNPLAMKELRKEVNKVRFMETEQAADDVIKARTKKVFYERCRLYYLPDNMTS